MGSSASDRCWRFLRVLLWASVLFAASGACALLAAPKPPKNPWKVVSLALADGTSIELREDAVARVRGGEVLWTVPAKEPKLPILFEDTKGTPLFLYFERLDGVHSAFRALRLDTGVPSWTHDFWGPQEIGFEPVAPVFFEHRIYFGRSLWLDALEPDAGVVVERHYAGDLITALEPQQEGSLKVILKVVEFPDPWPLTFKAGRLRNPLRAPSSTPQAIRLHNFACFPAPDFVYGSPDTSVVCFLDLHRYKTRSPDPEEIRKYGGCDLKAAEGKLREAWRQDPLNPYLPLFLSFCLHFQGRQAEAESAFARALEKCAISWHEPLWMGSRCEQLGFTRWADLLYEKGTAAYFQAVQAPADKVYVVDVLVNFPSQRLSKLLFLYGHTERAFDLIELRRRIFPFTEGDSLFSERYVSWLRKMGEDEKAAEEQRYASPIRHWELGWFFGGSRLGFAWFGLAWASWLLLIIVCVRVLGALGQILSLGPILAAVYFTLQEEAEVLSTVGRGELVGVSLFLVAMAVLAWRIVRWRPWLPSGEGAAIASSGISALLRKAYWAALSQSASFHVLALLAVYGGSALFTGAGWVWLAAVLAAAPLLWLFWRWGARRPGPVRVFTRAEERRQRLPSLLLAVLVWWALAAWLTYNSALLGVTVAFPLPTFDLGHPNMAAHLDALEKKALRPGKDLRFARALSAHLGGSPEEARRRYQELGGDARALNNLGVLLLPQDPKGAEGLFRRALAVDPACPPALYNLGLLTGDQTLIQRAGSLDPWHTESLQKYCPGKPMIATVSLDRIPSSAVWTWDLLKSMTNPMAGWRMFGGVFQLVRSIR